MMDEIEAWQNAMRKAERDIAQLRAERDEARRDLCRFYCANDTEWGSGPFPMEQSTPSMFATLKGWDCFKENTND